MKLHSLKKLKILFTLISTLATCQLLKNILKATGTQPNHLNAKTGETIKELTFNERCQLSMEGVDVQVCEQFINPSKTTSALWRCYV